MLVAFTLFSFICVHPVHSFAEDWGAYMLSPVSAPALALEAVGAGTSEGTAAAIDRPNGMPNQKWFIIPKGNNFYSIRPAYSSTLVLAAAKGGTANGTAIVLETDKGEPWQKWMIKRNENGVYNLIPGHAPDKGIDDLGGNQKPGTRQDLWTNTPGDQHLQWLIKPLAGTLSPDTNGASSRDTSAYIAPDIKPELVLKGEIKSTSFTRSSIFSGTVRQVTVFIPAQYKGSQPACVYVKTDGYNPREKQLLETLIATGEMPVTIGVFVSPGDLPAATVNNLLVNTSGKTIEKKNTLGRRNRDFEYDAVGDNNVRFLIEEILPFVAKEYGLKLSASGNDRCIAGGSSGGIAAFDAAWERPDAFSRVYANSGSFVAFRGGHEFPTLVRKFEAKPIRAYLTTGTNDMENCAGDWFLLDQEMDKALKFSGYDYTFRIINGGHVAGYYENFQEAMSFLWKSWPQAVQAGPSVPRVRDIIFSSTEIKQNSAENSTQKSSQTSEIGSEKWQEVKWPMAVQGYHNARGPACNASGEVFFADSPANKIYRISLDGTIKEFLANAQNANGLSFGAKGELYAVSSVTGRIMSYDPAGKGSLVVDGIHGRYILATPDGGLYVTTNGGKTATAGRGQQLQTVQTLSGYEDRPEDSGEVWYIKNGKKTLVASGLKYAAGLAYRPDQWLLSVAEGHSKWADSYQMNSDGSLTNKERYFWLHVPDWEDNAGAESVCYAREGQMLVATRFGIQVCADDGPTQVILPMPDRSRVIGVCLSGRDLDTLYAFCGNKIWKRKVKIHAIGAFTPWTALNGTRL